ncbi:MAG: YbdD/YjiX family protein [Alcaligenaceae bacterium]|jgi:uncharacterized short protein YbdD (DUF466 family)|nr:YbdD/YjiX family protein [Alcaligenaceae bacterium]
MFSNVAKAGRYLGQAARLMVGVPNYDVYLLHMGKEHPDQTPMTYEEFYRNRVNARYGGDGSFRCC